MSDTRRAGRVFPKEGESWRDWDEEKTLKTPEKPKGSKKKERKKSSDKSNASKKEKPPLPPPFHTTEKQSRSTSPFPPLTIIPQDSISQMHENPPSPNRVPFRNLDAKRKSIRTCQFVVAREQIDSNYNPFCHFLRSVRNGDLPMVQYLVENHQVDASQVLLAPPEGIEDLVAGDSALSIAQEEGHHHILKYLTEELGVMSEIVEDSFSGGKRLFSSTPPPSNSFLRSQSPRLHSPRSPLGYSAGAQPISTSSPISAISYLSVPGDSSPKKVFWDDDKLTSEFQASTTISVSSSPTHTVTLPPSFIESNTDSSATTTTATPNCSASPLLTSSPISPSLPIPIPPKLPPPCKHKDISFYTPEFLSNFSHSPKKAVKTLIERQYIDNSPYELAKFLTSLSDRIDKVALGEYLGERNDFAIECLKCFVKMMDFEGISFVKALRKMLSRFRLPGESQKIERITECFAEVYYEFAGEGIFAHPDTIFVLSYSTIMLNTDLHNPQVKKKMTLDQFITNNRGIDQGESLPDSYLQSIYEDIQMMSIRLNDDDPFPDAIKKGFLEIHFIKNQSRDRSKKKRKKFWCVLDTTRVLYLFLSPKNEAGVPVASFYFGDTVIIEVTSCNPKLTKFQIVDSLPPVAKRTPSPSPAPSFPPRSPPERPRTPPHSLEPFAPVPNPQGWVLRCHSSYTDFVSWRDTIKALSKVHIIDTEVGFAGSGGSNSRRRGGSAKGGGSVGRGSGKSSPGGSVRVGGSIGRKGGSLKKGSVGRKGGGVLKDSGRLDSGGKREDGPGFSKRVATVMEAGIGGVWWSGGEKGNWEGPEDGYVFMLVGDDVSRREFGILCQKMKGYCKRTRSSDEHQIGVFLDANGQEAIRVRDYGKGLDSQALLSGYQETHLILFVFMQDKKKDFLSTERDLKLFLNRGERLPPPPLLPIFCEVPAGATNPATISKTSVNFIEKVKKAWPSEWVEDLVCVNLDTGSGLKSLESGCLKAVQRGTGGGGSGCEIM